MIPGSRRSLRGMLAAAMLLGGARVSAAQQAGIITGRVVDRVAQTPVANAQVVIVGTTRGALTAEDGRYRIANAGAGTVQVRAQRIGYQSGTQPATVAAGQTVTVDFALAQTAVSIDEVVVTATGESQRRRETGNSVATIRADSINLATTSSFSDVLSSRASGVVVERASGTTGGGSRIRIRGSNSVSLSNDPLIIIDGVRVNNSSQSSTIDLGGQSPSRSEDINPEDIANIEVIKGPAAAALYGTAAANGVIQITTKRGQAGRTQWNAYGEGGTVRQETTFPANFRQVGLTPAGRRARACTLDDQDAGACSPKPDSLLSFNPLTQVNPFVKGWKEGYGLSAAGGSSGTTFFLSGDYNREQGVYSNNALRRTNLRANVRSQLRDNLDVSVQTGYLQSRLQLPQNDNNDLGILGNGLLGGATDNPITRGYAGFGPDISNAVTTKQDVDRLIGSVNSNWQPLDWLAVVGTSGIDFNTRHDRTLLPPGLIDEALRGLGNATSNPYEFWTYTANLNATASYGLGQSIRATTAVGTQYNNEVVNGTQAAANGLASGTGSVAGGTSSFQATEQNSKIVTIGGYAQEQLAWKDRVFLTGAVRGDDNSAFGNDLGLVYYPSVSLSWVLNEESYFPRQRWVNSLRLRSAYGRSGQRPGFRNAITFYNAVGVKSEGADIGGITVGGLGNPDLKPEISSELELGFDAGIFNDHANVEFTYYNKDTKDALIQRLLAPSVGSVPNRFENLGKVNNHGFEVLVNLKPIDARVATWDLTLTGSTNNNKLIDIGQGVDTIFFGLSAQSAPVQRFAQGFPLGGYWQRPILGYSDANKDGVITRNEVQLGDAPVYLGSPLPKTELAVNTGLTFFKWLRVSAQVDHRGGYKIYNSTAQFRCLFGNCREASDPKAPLADQARWVASLEGSDAGYIEDASFWKLRELAFTVTAPQRWASRVRASGLSLTVAGRNLKTWTNYTGFDPEINFAGQSNFSTADFLTQPPVRYWTARMNLNF